MLRSEFDEERDEERESVGERRSPQRIIITDFGLTRDLQVLSRILNDDDRDACARQIPYEYAH